MHYSSNPAQIEIEYHTYSQVQNLKNACVNVQEGAVHTWRLAFSCFCYPSPSAPRHKPSLYTKHPSCVTSYIGGPEAFRLNV